MRRLQVELLGGFSARRASGEACALPTRKARALVAYLALPTGRFHSREKLTALLWGDTAEAQAKHSFRQALFTLRRGLGDGNPPILLTTEDALALDPSAVTVDVAEFESALAARGMDGLERAAALYKGDLLDGFGVDEPSFEEWRVVERERLRELALEGLAKLLREQGRAERCEEAIQTALRILAMDPLQEAVHRTLMRLLVRQGRRAAALQQYQVCVSSLQRELGAEPDEETRQLYRELLRTTGPAADPLPAVVQAQSTPQVAAPVTRAAETPMIGREVDLERLRGAFARMLDDGGHVVLVSGEAGIGKSRLVQEFVMPAARSGARVAFGRCHETEQVLPFHPWIDALRGDRAALDASVRDRLGATATLQIGRVFPELRSGEQPLTASAQPAMLFDAFTELVAELASEQPMVIILEDLHWADSMSLRYLAFLARRIRRLPILIVASVRLEELIGVPVLAQAIEELRTEGRLEEITLSPLSEVESRALSRTLQPPAQAGSDRDRIEEEIWTLSEGNPFVIVESVRALGTNSPESWMRESRVARSVQDFVAARLERLGELPRHVVAVAAAIGRDFPFALLSHAARVGEHEAAAAVEELVRRRILDAVGDRLGFCHDWIRNVAYDRLLPQKRALLHAAIGDALEEHSEGVDDVADQLGHHYSKAGDARKALPHLVRFAELAVQRYALDDAYRSLQQALMAADRLPVSERDRCRLDVVLRQAFTLTLLGRHREILEILGSHASCVKRVADPALASEYYFRLALTHLYFCEQAQGFLAAEQALREGERSEEPERIGKALHVLAVAAYATGDPERGIVYATRSLPLLDRPRTQHYLGLAYLDLALNYVVAGALASALEAVERCEAIGHSIQDARLQAHGGYAAWMHALRGDIDRAIVAARRGVELSPERLTANLNTGFLGQAYLEGGDAGSAIPALEQAVQVLGSIPIRWVERRYMSLLSEAYLLAGDASRARHTAARALELSRTDGMPFNIGLAQRALGRVALAGKDLDEAEGHLLQALVTFAECRATFEAARTHCDLAAVRAAKGNRDAAKEHLATALATFEAADAPKRVAAALDLARSLDIAPADS